MDRLRRCDARDAHGHRCNKHVNHLRETKESKTGTELAQDESYVKLHSAFGHTWS